MTTPVVVELRADGRGVIAAFRTTREEAGKLQGQLDRNATSSTRAGQATEELGNKTESATARMRRFQAAAAAAVAALGLRQIARAADQMTLLRARLDLVTDSQAEFNRAQQATFAIANQNGQSIGAVGELYVRLAQSLGDAGASSGELETITQAVTQSMRVSGASAAEASGAIRQLSQAFASGVLRGDEFNSVNEQAPRLMQALADSLGRTRGELRELAEQGQLTSDLLRRALVEEAGDIARESAKIPQTIGEAFTQLQNQAFQAIDSINEVTNASQQFAAVISGVASNLDVLLDVLLVVGITALGRYTASIIAARQSTVAYTIATIRARAAVASMAGGSRAAATAVAALTAASRGLLAILGGPVGLAILGVSLALTFGGDVVGALSASRRELEDMIDPSDAARESILRLSTALEFPDAAQSLGSIRSELRNLREEADQVTEALRRARSLRTDRGAFGFSDSLPGAARSGLELDLEDRLQVINEQIRLAQQLSGEAQFDDLALLIDGLGRAAAFAAPLLEKFAGAQEQAAATDKFATAMTESNQALRLQLIALTSGTQAAQNYQDALLLAAAAEQDALDGTTANTDAVREQISARDALEDAISGVTERQKEAEKAARDAAEALREQAEVTREFEERLFSLRQELAGPLQNAQVELQRDAADMFQLFATGQITFDQFGQGLDLLNQRFEETRDEIGSRMAQTLQDLAFDHLPPVIRQMLGLADATGKVAREAGALSQIGSNFAQSVIQGNGVQDSLGNALVGFGGQTISEAFDNPKVAEKLGEVFSSAFENMDIDGETLKNLSGGFALALGQAVDGNIGQAAFTAAGNLVGEKIGSKLGEELGGFGGAIGSIIGSILGDAIFGESVAKFQVRGPNATRATDAGTDEIIGTLFGDIEFAFRKIDENAQNELIRIFDGFFDTLGVSVRDAARRADIQEIVQGFGISSRSGPDTPEQQLNLLLDEILAGAFEDFEAAFVNVGNTLEERLSRLNDLFQITNQVTLGNDLGLGLKGLLPLMDEVRIGNEALIDTYERNIETVDGLRRAAALTGNQFASTSEGLVRFGAELVSIFGDDAGAFSGMLNRVLEAAFSDEELDNQTINAARQRATDLLTQLGIEVTEQTFTQQGLQDLLKNFLGAFGPEETAQLLAAGDAIATVLGITTDSTEKAASGLSDAATTILQSLAPARLEFLRLSETLDELIETEGELGFARQAAEIQIQGFIASLQQSIPNLVDELFGTTEDADREIQRGITNTRDAWLSAIDSIQSALDSQLVGPNSSLNNREQITEIESQLAQAVQAANAGDLGAAQQVSGLFNQAIAQGASFFGTSTDDFAEFEQRIRGLAASVPANATIPPEITTAQNTGEIARNTRRMERSAFEDFQLSLNLADQIDLLARLTGDSPAEIGKQFDVPIGKLIAKLTGEVPDLTGEALGAEFNNLITGLGDELNDFASLEGLVGTTNTLLVDIRDFFLGGDFADKLGQSAGAEQEGSGSAGGSATFGGDSLTQFTTGGPVDFTGPAIVDDGEFVVRRGGTLVSRDPGLLREIRALREEVRSGNADRRNIAELTIEEAEQMRQLLARNRGVARTTPSRRTVQ